MKARGIEKMKNVGLRVYTSEFTRLKAFQGGGYYWDHQELVREGLGTFLPAVEQSRDDGAGTAVFRESYGGSEGLASSSSASEARIPSEQVKELQEALSAFKLKADAADTTPHARQMIREFRLPDVDKDPDLYRLCGPWWNRRLQVLWGCERTPDSSLSPLDAVAKLPKDKGYGVKRALALGLLLFLMCALAMALFRGWPIAKQWAARQFNKAPTAGLKLDSLDETNKTATVSDESRDEDGSVKSWHIDWGDGQMNAFAERPISARHEYETERDYTITLWCVDDIGATSAPPAVVHAKFDLEKRQSAMAAILRAKNEAERESLEAAKARTEVEKLLAATNEKRKEMEEATRQAEALKSAAEQDRATAAKMKEEADKAHTAAAKVKEDAEREREETAKTTKTPAPQLAPFEPRENAGRAEGTVTNANSGGPGREPDGGEDTVNRHPSLDERKGAQLLLRDGLRQYEIRKAGAGVWRKGDTLEALLVVRDMRSPNARVDVEFWEVGDKQYPVAHPLFTAFLPLGEHKVRVAIRAQGAPLTFRAAKVTVTANAPQATLADFTVEPLW
jgi:hypothetical protein